MKSWVNIAGDHINLATASRIEEIGPQGLQGYRIYHGSHCTEFFTEGNKAFADVATRIRFWLFDKEINNA